ncbi:MAG: hypothetical protein QOD88_3761 [Mycobacterium sp.]|jgi:hypothetical protein|nr:hypothetical protein [Mycobacterium sp.]
MRKVAERYGPIDVRSDTTESVRWTTGRRARLTGRHAPRINGPTVIEPAIGRPSPVDRCRVSLRQRTRSLLLHTFEHDFLSSSDWTDSSW